MCKPFFLCAALTLLVSGCQSVKRSAGPSPSVWRQVTAVARADARGGDPERAYADALHSTLQKARVEHKVVTFSHGTDAGFDSVRRTVVIYRDTSNAKFPWWAMDQHLEKPVWLPNETTGRQVQFLARRPASVVEEKFYAAGPDAGKNIRPTEKSEPTKTKAAKKSAAKTEPPRRDPVKAKAPAENTSKPARVKAASPAPKAEPDKQPVAAKPEAAPTTLDGASAATPAAKPQPKPELINKETPGLLWPKLAPKPKEPPVAKPGEAPANPDQLAPLPITPPANLKEPKPIVPKPVPKLRTKPSELDVPKPDAPKPGTSRRNFFQRLFARA